MAACLRIVMGIQEKFRDTEKFKLVGPGDKFDTVVEDSEEKSRINMTLSYSKEYYHLLG